MQVSPVRKFLIIGLASVFLGSCISRKKIVYFIGDEENKAMQPKNELFFEVGDLISVDVTGTDPEVAKPFNQAEMVRQGNLSSSYDNGVPATYGYLIHEDSTVSLPILGNVVAAGLNHEELTDLLEEKLVAYLEQPQVSIRLLNFKITVLGDVKNPGTYTIPNERVSLLEAIGIANDLNPTGRRDNVLVIRIEEGVKKEFRVDLTSKAIFESPVYYLKQNDVVYVEPNMRTRYESSILRTAGSSIIAATSLIVSTIILIRK